jgi:molecular chaperone DnaJ
MPGQGEVGPAGGPSGDLFLEVRVHHHDVFSRDGDDLLATLEVQMTDAILGTTTTIDGLDGPVELEVRPGVQSADVLVIKDRGITKLRGSGRGDLRVGVQVVTPTKLSHKERQLVEQLAKSHKSAAPQLARFQQGMFGKLRDRFFNF